MIDDDDDDDDDDDGLKTSKARMSSLPSCVFHADESHTCEA